MSDVVSGKYFCVGRRVRDLLTAPFQPKIIALRDRRCRRTTWDRNDARGGGHGLDSRPNG